MVRSIEKLRAASDDDLIAEHDAQAPHAVVATGYYQDELARREQRRAIESTNKLSGGAFWLTVANTVLAAVAAVAAIIALLQ